MNPQTEQQRQATFQAAGQQPVPQSTVVAPPVSTTIDASNLGQGSSLQFPPTPAPQDFASIFASIPTVEQVQQQAGMTVSAQTPAEKTNQSIADKLLAGYQKITGKAGAQLQAEQSAGLPQFQAQLTDINSQLTSLSNEAKAIPLQIQNDFQGRGATAGGVRPIENAKLRENAIKSLGLSSIAQVLQGNIATAQRTADRAVELEFAPAQAELDYLAKVYEMNKDSLSREDKKRTEALAIGYAERQRLLDNQKEDKKITYGWVAEASKNGAPTVLINKALAQGPTEALATLSGFMADPIEKESELTNLALKREQLRQSPIEFAMEQKAKAAQIASSNASAANSYASAAKTRAEMNQIKNPTSTNVVTSTGKPLNDAQSLSLGYANRVQQASQIIDSVGSKFTGRGSVMSGLIPNIYKSEDRQKFEQAQTNFINAVLRKESGAAISPSEFDSARRQYFPQPGDLKGVLEQKKANRDLVYLNLMQSAGNPKLPASLDEQTVNGVIYSKGTDGLYYLKK